MLLLDLLAELRGVDLTKAQVRQFAGHAQFFRRRR